MVMRFFTAVSSLFLLLPLFIVSIPSSRSLDPTIKGISLENPVVEVTPLPIPGHTQGSKDVVFCERVRVSGISRLKLESFASAYRVNVVPSVVIPERLHSKIQICFHQNASLGLCQCEEDDWKYIQKGLWSSLMSPYEDRYVDIKSVGDVHGSLSVTVDEEVQGWRYIFLAFGISFLLLAPIVSSWVPFYYSSSMVIGVLLVILIILFQGMKLLPTGRKSAFYLVIYGSVLGAGSLLVHYFSVLVNSILLNFGLSQEMHNPVSVFLLVGIGIAGAGLGYWLVRKFVISEDGGVDVGIAQFVKWAMRVVAVTSIFQSTIDIPLAMATEASCLGVYYLITSLKRRRQQAAYPQKKNLWGTNGQANANRSGPEFLRRSRKITPQRTFWNGPRNSFAWSDSPVKGIVSPSSGKGAGSRDEHYSTFHKTPNRKKYSKKEWEDFTEESTRQAVAELASSPEFTDWIIKNTDRLQLLPDECSDVVESGSDSTDENVVHSMDNHGLFPWQMRK